MCIRDREVPQYLLDELKMAADKVSQLDQKMEEIHREISKIKEPIDSEELQEILINDEVYYIPDDFISSYKDLDKKAE